MEIEMSKKATRFADKLLKSNPIAARQIAQQTQKLAQNPLRQGVCKVSGGQEEEMRATAGAYRIIYCIYAERNVLFVKLIGKRNDDEIYRQHSRLLQ